MTGFHTIRAGERVAVWNRRGQVRFVDGPRRLWLFRETVQSLTRFSAKAGEYLDIQFQDGRSEHLAGPASVWFDPVAHERIDLARAISIDGHEALVVYRRDGDVVTRRIVRGPALFVPTQDEWLHEFCWHGADPKRPDVKVPRGLHFTKIRVIPDQMYFDVGEVRTADDALLVVRLMVFFELADIERMLDQTHDVVGDFINAVSADVIDFVAACNFEQFKARTEQLNDLGTYLQLRGRAEAIGYRINKVVYRGYHASDKLQAMHDDAIEKRTHLRLEAETERQAQDLADLKLTRETERAHLQQQLQREQVEHENGLKRLAHEEKLRAAATEQHQDAEARRQINQLEVEHAAAKNAEQLNLLKSMREMQVDLTRYLVAQYQHPDRLIRIQGDNDAQLHLHEN